MKEAAWAREGGEIGERKRRGGSQVYGGEEGGGVDEVEGEGGGEGERGRGAYADGGGDEDEYKWGAACRYYAWGQTDVAHLIAARHHLLNTLWRQIRVEGLPLCTTL